MLQSRLLALTMQCCISVSKFIRQSNWNLTWSSAFWLEISSNLRHHQRHVTVMHAINVLLERFESNLLALSVQFLQSGYTSSDFNDTVFFFRSHAHIESSLDLLLLVYINYQTWMGDVDCASLIGYYMTHIHIVTQGRGGTKACCLVKQRRNHEMIRYEHKNREKLFWLTVFCYYLL